MPQHHKKRGRGIPIGHRMLEWNVNSIIALDLLNLGSVDIQQCALFTCSKEWLPFQIWMMNSKWKHHVIIFPQRKKQRAKKQLKDWVLFKNLTVENFDSVQVAAKNLGDVARRLLSDTHPEFSVDRTKYFQKR